MRDRERLRMDILPLRRRRKTVVRTEVLFSAVLIVWGGCSARRTGAAGPDRMDDAYMGQRPPANGPEVFAPGIVSTEATELSPSLSPDLREFYFTRSIDGRLVLHVTRENGGTWSEPEPVAFGSEYPEDNVFVTPDNRRAWYSSLRPTSDGEKPRGDYDLWFTDRDAAGWSRPTHAGGGMNADAGTSAGSAGLTGNDFHPSVALSGDLYFASAREGGRGSYDIYVAERTDSGYSAPRPLPETINTPFMENGPAISPDERYIVFSSDEATGDEGDFGDLFVSFRAGDGTWSRRVRLRGDVNSASTDNTPVISPHGKFLFFASKRSGVFNIYWVSTEVIAAAAPAAASR